MAPPAHEDLVTAGRCQEAHLQYTVPCEADGHAPRAQTAQEGLRAIDGVDDPDVPRVGDVVEPGLLTEEGVPGKALGDATADELLDLDIGLADDVLRALRLDGERLQASVEVAKRQRGGIDDERPARSQALVQSVGQRASSAHIQAAPRTPLESPCTALTMGVVKTLVKV